MDKSELESYVSSIKLSLLDLRSVVKNWEKVDTLKSAWGPEHEATMTNLSILLDNVSKITFPGVFLPYHDKLLRLNDQIIKELREVQSDLCSQETMSSDSKKRQRAYNSVNLLMNDIESVRTKFISVIIATCEFNNVSCQIQ